MIDVWGVYERGRVREHDYRLLPLLQTTFTNMCVTCLSLSLKKRKVSCAEDEDLLLITIKKATIASRTMKDYVDRL